jgi:hypothetical protein
MMTLERHCSGEKVAGDENFGRWLDRALRRLMAYRLHPIGNPKRKV